jgi:hypothetical protein
MLLQASACGSATEIMACAASGTLACSESLPDRATRRRKRRVGPSPSFSPSRRGHPRKARHPVVAQILQWIDAIRSRQGFGVRAQFRDGGQRCPCRGRHATGELLATADPCGAIVWPAGDELRHRAPASSARPGTAPPCKHPKKFLTPSARSDRRRAPVAAGGAQGLWLLRQPARRIGSANLRRAGGGHDLASRATRKSLICRMLAGG